MSVAADDGDDAAAMRLCAITGDASSRSSIGTSALAVGTRGPNIVASWMQVAGGQTAIGERETSTLTAHHLPPA